MNFQPHEQIQLKDGTAYDTDYLLEPYMFGMRCLIHAQRPGEVVIGFTVYFPPSFFGTRSVQHHEIIQRAFEEVRLALENKTDEVQVARSNPAGYEINCDTP